jgi:uncharacterized membrane protein YkvA (DUF1232 family)
MRRTTGDIDAVVYLAARDPRTPWYARVLAAAVVTYALSPIDLIPDFIPVLGYLDDLIIVRAGIALTLRFVPTDVMVECRACAAVWAERQQGWRRRHAHALEAVAIWAALFVRGLLQ